MMRFPIYGKIKNGNQTTNQNIIKLSVSVASSCTSTSFIGHGSHGSHRLSRFLPPHRTCERNWRSSSLCCTCLVQPSSDHPLDIPWLIPWLSHAIPDSKPRQNFTGWWFFRHPSEKYEFVIWDDEIPNINGKIQKMATSYHQPDNC